MDIFNYLKTIVKQPQILRPYDRIILLSHMRANTSLLGHVLGSHPEINGYYELHIGYYSWKSLTRQKLIYCHEHSLKKNSRYFFDKILHNDHFVNPKLFNDHNSKVIIMIRAPRSTINSIIKLYKKNDPGHKLATVEGATAYYSDRLEGLLQLAMKFKGKYFYLDADSLTINPDLTLSKLSGWLKLKPMLTKEYQIFKKTGQKRAGDNSEQMMSGVIQQKRSSGTMIQNIPQKIHNQYQLILDNIIASSDVAEMHSRSDR